MPRDFLTLLAAWAPLWGPMFVGLAGLALLGTRPVHGRGRLLRWLIRLGQTVLAGPPSPAWMLRILAWSIVPFGLMWTLLEWPPELATLWRYGFAEWENPIFSLSRPKQVLAIILISAYWWGAVEGVLWLSRRLERGVQALGRGLRRGRRSDHRR